MDVPAGDRAGEGGGRIVLHHEERGGRGRAVGDGTRAVSIAIGGELRQTAESLGVTVEVEGATIDIEFGHRGHGRGRDDQERIGRQSGPEPERAVVHGGPSRVITGPGERHDAIAGLDQTTRTQSRRTEGESRGAAEHVEVQRVARGGYGATGEASVVRVDDDTTAGDRQRVERASQTEHLSRGALRRSQVAAAEIPYPASAVQREALDRGRGLHRECAGRGNIRTRRHGESESSLPGGHRHGGGVGEGDAISADGGDRGADRDTVDGSLEALSKAQAGDVGQGDDGSGSGSGDRGARQDGPEALEGSGGSQILRGGQQAEAVGIVGDEAADGVAAVDADDVGADAIRDGAGDRGIGAGQVGRRDDDVDAVGAGGTSTQRTRGTGVQRQRPMQRAGRRVERGDGDARLIAAVLSEVPDRLAGDVLGRPEGLDDGGGGTAGIIQHTSAIIEHTVVGGLDGTDAAQSVAESVRAVEREHAAETQVGGDEAELACRLVEDHRAAEDRERAEQAGRAVPG